MSIMRLLFSKISEKLSKPPQSNKKWEWIGYRKPFTKKIFGFKINYDKTFYVKILIPQELRKHHSGKVKNYEKYNTVYTGDEIVDFLQKRGSKVKFLKLIRRKYDHKWGFDHYEEYVPVFKK